MIEPLKAYSRRHLITVAELANTLAASRNIAGIEAVQQLAEAVRAGILCKDLYPPHQQWQHGGDAKRIGKPSGNSPEVWNSLAVLSAERHLSDKDDFDYPPAASTWHVLAEDVMLFAAHPSLHDGVSAALRRLAVSYKPELIGESRSMPEASGQPIKSTTSSIEETHQDAQFRNEAKMPFARATQTPAVESSQPIAEVQAAVRSGAPLSDHASKASTEGISTLQVAAMFGGLPFTAENWPKRLSSAKWTKEARVGRGAAGGSSSTWDPAILARIIHGRAQKEVKQKTLEDLSKRFRRYSELAPWRADWDEHCEMFSDAGR